jgi:hypothetical protein
VSIRKLRERVEQGWIGEVPIQPLSILSGWILNSFSFGEILGEGRMIMNDIGIGNVRAGVSGIRFYLVPGILENL